MTIDTTKTITAAIILFALASALMAAPANASPVMPADLEKAAAQSNHQNASENCAHSRFGCPFEAR